MDLMGLRSLSWSVALLVLLLLLVVVEEEEEEEEEEDVLEEALFLTSFLAEELVEDRMTRGVIAESTGTTC